MSAAVIRLMRELRTRPHLRLQQPSLARMGGYVGGYILARGIVAENELMLDFDEWIRLLFGVRWNGNSESVIGLFADDDAQAVTMYFDLFDDFIEWRAGDRAKNVMPMRPRFRGAEYTLPRYTFDELLEELRAHPAMYIGSRLLSRLLAYVRGFVAGRYEIGMSEGKQRIDDFDRWVRRHYHSAVRHDAESLIVFHNFEDHSSLEPFWKLFDEFTQQTQRGIGLDKDRT